MHELYPVVLGWCLLVCLGAAGGWDLRTGRVPNWWLAFWYGVGLWGWACGGWVGAAGYIGRSLAVVGVFFPLFVCRMMGAGDIKCMALICGYLGFSVGLRAIGAGMALGVGWGLIRWANRGGIRGRLQYLAAYLGRARREKRLYAYHIGKKGGETGTVPLVFFLFLGLAAVWPLGYGR